MHKLQPCVHAGDGTAPVRQRTPLAQLKNLRISVPQPAMGPPQTTAAKVQSGRQKALELGAKTFAEFKERRQRHRHDACCLTSNT